jgi:transposase-like protein/transcription elongation factor Elf1
MEKENNIKNLVRWLCSKLTIKELVVAITIISEVILGCRDDIKTRNDFKEKHPNYRDFHVDPLQPLTEIPELIPKNDFKKLLALYRLDKGKELKPVKRHKNSQLPPPYSKCPNCNAPSKYLYVNDGGKKSQLLCKICNTLFQSHRIRIESKTKYWCPHCNRALYLWKNDGSKTIYKCGNKSCPCYIKNLNKLNDKEKMLQKSGMSSQFKLAYQYREYYFTPADLQTAQPLETSHSFSRIHNTFNTVGLVLTYSVSCGLSSRQTCFIMREVHNIKLSHQTVLNYQENAAHLASKFLQKNIGTMTDKQIAADEAYIKINDKWHYTWLVIGAESRAIRAFNVSDNRGVMPALATLTQSMKNAPEKLNHPIEIIADGNPSYDAAVHAINANKDGTPLKRRKVIGLTNLDEESETFRPFKQLIERLNRTYNFHTRARCGFKSTNGAVALTTLFVAYYNFLRPHSSLNFKPPIQLDDFKNISTLQGKWLKLLQSAA